jgi:TatA/E family protein of Tat protein translocase
MFNIGPLELIVILIVALLVVGPNKLPEVGRSIGRGLREFRKAQEEVQRSLRLSLDDEPPSRPMRGSDTASVERDRDGEDEGVPVTPSTGARSGESAGAGARGDLDDVAKALGRGLADLRRAKEELQSSFRLDPNDQGGNGSRAG